VFRISDFSRFTRVSVRMLRHYDRLGLLRPAHVDPHSRYRWYSARQLPRLQRILALRDLGFSLEHIAGLLDEDPRGKSLRRLLELRRGQIEHEIGEGRRRVAQIEAQLERLDRRDAALLPDVVLRRVPPVRVAAARARVADLDDGVEAMFEKLEREVARAGARAAGPPLLLYHDRDGRTERADVEVAVPVTPAATAAGRHRVRTLPAIETAACASYVGGYDQWWDVAEGILGTLEARRLEPAGPIREVFLQFRAGDPEGLGLPRAYLAERDEDLVTEMQVPVRATGSGEGRASRRSKSRRRDASGRSLRERG